MSGSAVKHDKISKFNDMIHNNLIQYDEGIYYLSHSAGF